MRTMRTLNKIKVADWQLIPVEGGVVVRGFDWRSPDVIVQSQPIQGVIGRGMLLTEGTAYEIISMSTARDWLVDLREAQPDVYRILWDSGIFPPLNRAMYGPKP